MQRTPLAFLMSLVWLIAGPGLQWPVTGGVDLGVTPAAAKPAKADSIKLVQAQTTDQPKSVEQLQHVDTPKAAAKKPVTKTTKKRVGLSSLVTNNPMPTIVTQPPVPMVTDTEPGPYHLLRYWNVPAVRAFGAATSQGRVIRCRHQGAYSHKCAF